VYAPPPPPPPVNPRRRRALIVVAVVWGVLLATTGVWYSLHGRATAREQTTVEAAGATVDTAIQNVVRAAGASVVPAVSGFEKAGGCSVTPVRSGVTYQRVAWLYTPVGSEPALLDRLAAGLPASYDAKAHHSPGGAVHTLAADAGNFVAVTGSVSLPGLVRVVADTGCRPLGRAPAADPAVAPVDNPFGVAGDWHAHALPCGLRTVEAHGTGRQPLTGPAGAAAVVSTPDVYADRTGLAARTGNGVTVTVTSGTCR
jgi:type II secretory pathway pseudopilin PulG